MKRIEKIALPGKRKDKYNRICDGYDWRLDKLVFDKEEPRSKTKGKWETGEATQSL